MARSLLSRAAFLGCLAVALLLVVGSTEAMQFRGSDDSMAEAAAGAANAQTQQDAASSVAEDGTHEMDQDEHDSHTAEDSAAGEMESNEGSPSFVQQASNKDVDEASQGEMDSLDAEAEPGSTHDAEMGGEESGMAGDGGAGTTDMDNSGEASDAEMMGGDPVDQDIQPHYE